MQQVNAYQDEMDIQDDTLHSNASETQYGGSLKNSMLDQSLKKTLGIGLKQSSLISQEALGSTDKKVKQRPLSPLLDKKERDEMRDLGQSLDSKKVTSALGYLDLKQICFCLAQGIMKHITFSKG